MDIVYLQCRGLQFTHESMVEMRAQNCGQCSAGREPPWMANCDAFATRWWATGRIIAGWWFQPLWKLLVNWDYCSQYMESHKIHVPNHQPDRVARPTRGRNILMTNHSDDKVKCGTTGVVIADRLTLADFDEGHRKTHQIITQGVHCNGVTHSWALQLILMTFHV